MSYAKPSTHPETVHLLPRQITTNPALNARPFSSTNTAAEDKLVEALANSMEQCGQLDNILITPKYELICGNRRRSAAIVINERRTVRGESLFHLRCTIDYSTDDLWRKAIMSNLHRKESSVMELAYLITQIRAKFSWKGIDGYTKVAEYLGIDRAAVYQAERFLGAKTWIQNMLHTGELTIQNATRLMRMPNEPDRVKAMELAQQYQEEENLDKILRQNKNKHKNATEATKAIQEIKVTRVEGPAMARAIREVAAAPTRVALTRTELLEALNKLDQSGIPQTHHEFISYLVTVFAKGHGTFKELRTRFNMIGISLPLASDVTISHSPPN